MTFSHSDLAKKAVLEIESLEFPLKGVRASLLNDLDHKDFDTSFKTM